jgi:predicted NAD-dependent protein-ADP-ribosyltransferase YbiA (DUF1768 family)
LFKKVKDPATGEPIVYTPKGDGKKKYYIYKATNAWGARERAQEFYNVEKPSKIDNGFIKVTTPSSDESIIGIFTGKGTLSTQTQTASKTSQQSTTSEFDKLPSPSDKKTMTYAGVGSRQAPPAILAEMTQVAKELAAIGYTLNTGVAFGGKEEGADAAFSRGTNKKNLFSPEKQGLRNRERSIAREIHPNPSALSAGGLQLMARNTNQVFGENLDTPVDFVLFWAKETNNPLRPEGGTGQAVEIARRKGIPTINMMDSNWRQQLNNVLSGKSSQPSSKTVVATPVSKMIIDKNKKINIYAGTRENAELSNFAERPFTLDENSIKILDRELYLGVKKGIEENFKGLEKIQFKSVEQAFQFMKSLFSEDNDKTEETAKEILNTTNGGTLKTLGRKFDLKQFTNPVTENKSIIWDNSASDIMKVLLKNSFEQNPKALEQLLATGNAELTHKYKGVEQDNGRFSKLLMEVRFELANAKTLESLGFSPTEIGNIINKICNGNMS